MDKLKTSIDVDPELWMEFKLYCVKNKINYGKMISRLITEEIKRSRKNG